MRSYDDYESMKSKIKKIQQQNGIIADLKGEAMKDRHWKRLLRELAIRKSFNEITLYDLWDLDLNKYKKVVNEILS
jgi:dynein heavy chain 1, cytosolic